jgi:flagellar basal body-associated protein FliL
LYGMGILSWLLIGNGLVAHIMSLWSYSYWHSNKKACARMHTERSIEPYMYNQ